MTTIGAIGHRSPGMGPLRESLNEQWTRQADAADEETSAAAVLNRFVQSSDEMAASLRSQFRRRGDMGDKLEGLADRFERVLEEDALPKAMQIFSVARQPGVSIDWLLQQARGLFPDDSDLVLVLRELLRRQEMPVVARQRLEQMLQQVIEQAPPKRLKAGINCALKARLFGRKLALKASMMRETYRAFLETDDDPVGCYEDWIALYGEGHRADVLDFVEAALLTDIDALDPSCSRSEFGQLLQRLGQLMCLRSAEVLFVQRLCGDALVRRHNDDPMQWLTFLLGILRGPDQLDPLLAATLSQPLLLSTHGDRCAVLQMVRLACLSLPLALFRDDQALMQLAEQFSRLASTALRQEAIERHTAYHHAQR